MKQLFIALLFTCVSSTLFAAESNKKVSVDLVRVLRSTYPNAENVKWETIGQMTVANFTVDSQAMSVYFHSDGSIAVIAEVITKADLPKSLRRTFDETFASERVIGVYRLESDEVKFVCEVLKDGSKEIYQSSGSKWELFKTKR